jgi:hypothetical protein
LYNNIHKCTKVFHALAPPIRNICKGFVRFLMFCIVYGQQLLVVCHLIISYMKKNIHMNHVHLLVNNYHSLMISFFHVFCSFDKSYFSICLVFLNDTCVYIDCLYQCLPMGLFHAFFIFQNFDCEYSQFIFTLIHGVEII